MSNKPFFIWYVANPVASAEFYTRLLGKPPVEASPGFALFEMDNGMQLGMWLRNAVQPAAGAAATASGELVFGQNSKKEVDQRYREMRELGLSIVQEPLDMDFGYTFVACDPDGHRLRVYVAAEG